MARLAALPDGTLGKEFERYLTANDLDANLLRESAFIKAHHERGKDVGYLAERGFKLHDLFHVLTGFDTTPLMRVHWEESWERPLADLRTEYHLV